MTEWASSVLFQIEKKKKVAEKALLFAVTDGSAIVKAGIKSMGWHGSKTADSQKLLKSTGFQGWKTPRVTVVLEEECVITLREVQPRLQQHGKESLVCVSDSGLKNGGNPVWQESEESGDWGRNWEGIIRRKIKRGFGKKK